MTETRTISISIARPTQQVYDYLARPAHFPEWSAFITAIRPEGEHWLASTQNGEVRIRFTPRNSYGVLDHEVQVGPGVTVFVPMRVVRNQAGSEVLFTIFRQPEMNAQEYEADVEMVRTDLFSLKQLLEGEKTP